MKVYNTGSLTPRRLLEVARPESHPLHDRFEWNDSVAGEKYRLVQARDLIKSVKLRMIDANNEQLVVPEFVSVTRPTGTAYESVETISQDPMLSAIVLREAEREWKIFERRYRHLDVIMKMVRDAVA
jgi:hypothetical protein